MQTEYFFSHLKVQVKATQLHHLHPARLGKLLLCRLTVNIEVCTEVFFFANKYSKHETEYLNVTPGSFINVAN